MAVDAAYHREWRKKNPGKAREAQARYRAANREKVLSEKRAYNKRHAARIYAQKMQWRVDNLERAREYERTKGRKRAKLPEPTRPAPAVCEACERASTHALCIDHDHLTGAFRGWLCHACNRGIGSLGDSVNGVQKALAYLERVEKDHVG